MRALRGGRPPCAALAGGGRRAAAGGAARPLAARMAAASEGARSARPTRLLSRAPGAAMRSSASRRASAAGSACRRQRSATAACAGTTSEDHSATEASSLTPEQQKRLDKLLDLGVSARKLEQQDTQGRLLKQSFEHATMPTFLKLQELGISDNAICSYPDLLWSDFENNTLPMFRKLRKLGTPIPALAPQPPHEHSPASSAREPVRGQVARRAAPRCACDAPGSPLTRCNAVNALCLLTHMCASVCARLRVRRSQAYLRRRSVRIRNCCCITSTSRRWRLARGSTRWGQ